MSMQLLSILENNSRLDSDKLAAMSGMSVQEVESAIERYEKDGIIQGYRTLVDWDKTDREYVTARIEIRVAPKRNMGFDEIASTIASFDEVETVYLMSGGYDLALTVSGKTFKDIAMFVSKKLSPLDSVKSTATSFILHKYKKAGFIVSEEQGDEREEGSLC